MRTHSVATAIDRPPSTWRFGLLTLAWSLAFFAVLRHPLTERLIVQTLIRFQTTLAVWYGAHPTGGVTVEASCSGADVLALFLGAILAYPLGWRQRLAGAAGGIALILTINTIRIGSLLGTAPGSSWFNTLHVYVWPSILVVTTLLYVLVWTQALDRRRSRNISRPIVRFGGMVVLFLLVQAAIAPWAMTSAIVLGACDWAVAITRGALELVGVSVTGTGSFLTVRSATIQVTPECLLTPTLPVYLAALVCAPASRHQRFVGMVAVVPLFFALAVARLLVLAIPSSVLATPLIAVHGFFQILSGGVAILAVSIASSRSTVAGPVRFGLAPRVAAGLLGAIGVAAVLGHSWQAIVQFGAHGFHYVAPHAITVLRQPRDIQGALVLLPAYQLALMIGLWLATIGDRRIRLHDVPLALFCLLSSQVLLLVGLGELAAHTGIVAHPILVRAWSVGAPIGLYLLMQVDRLGTADDESYRYFWDGVGRDFPVLTGAASTDFYFANEVRLLSEALPELKDCRLLKTDLWDEAKNTRILQWAAAQGAHVYGVDISAPIVVQSRHAFEDMRLDAAQADVRALPFADNVFDAVYSMGTIEHFAESEAAVRDIARVLKPGGRLVLGVPNRHDPFLRPLLVAILSRCGLYAYGFEKSYSRRALRQMLEESGLEVVSESGILFIPGWLRMLDLACYTRWRSLARVTALAVAPFAWLDRRFAGLRRHGYLLASTAIKPIGGRRP